MSSAERSPLLAVTSSRPAKSATPSLLCLGSGNNVMYSAVAHLLLVVSLVVLVVLRVTLAAWSPVCLGLAGAAYLAVWAETFFSYDFMYLRAMRNSADFGSYLHHLHTATPRIFMKLESFKEKMDYTYTQTTNYAGQTVTQTNYGPVRYNLGANTEELEVSAARDVSEPTPAITAPTRVSLRLAFCLADAENEARYAAAAGGFRMRHYRGNTHNYTERLELPGYTPYLLTYPSDAPAPGSPALYLLFTALALSWPYRWYLRAHSRHVVYTVVKQLSLPADPAQTDTGSTAK